MSLLETFLAGIDKGIVDKTVDDIAEHADESSSRREHRRENCPRRARDRSYTM